MAFALSVLLWVGLFIACRRAQRQSAWQRLEKATQQVVSAVGTRVIGAVIVLLSLIPIVITGILLAKVI